jgi:hypothetical protein
MTDQNQMKYVEFFSYLGSRIRNDGRSTVKLNPAAKSLLLWPEKMDLNLRRSLVSATFGGQLCVVLQLGLVGKGIRNSWEVLKYGAGEGWIRSVGPIV